MEEAKRCLQFNEQTKGKQFVWSISINVYRSGWMVCKFRIHRSWYSIESRSPISHQYPHCRFYCFLYAACSKYRTGFSSLSRVVIMLPPSLSTDRTPFLTCVLFPSTCKAALNQGWCWLLCHSPEWLRWASAFSHTRCEIEKDCLVWLEKSVN